MNLNGGIRKHKIDTKQSQTRFERLSEAFAMLDKGIVQTATDSLIAIRHRAVIEISTHDFLSLIFRYMIMYRLCLCRSLGIGVLHFSHDIFDTIPVCVLVFTELFDRIVVFIAEMHGLEVRIVYTEWFTIYFQIGIGTLIAPFSFEMYHTSIDDLMLGKNSQSP